MDETKKTVSIRVKMFIFIIITVFAVALGTSAIAFRTGANQIDKYYKQNTADNARNFASFMNEKAEFLETLRSVAESDEYQKLRDRAEEEENEALIEAYLKEKDLWTEYEEIREMLTEYIQNMEGIKYLYIIAHGDINAEYDMYLVDDKENPIYETGYYEERESELLGIDLEHIPEPTISNGDWGWLCSDFKPVYNKDGKCICIVGCDIGMDDVMVERQRMLYLLILGTLLIATVILIAAFLFINSTIVKPLNSMTNEMKKFNPGENLSYEEAGVIDIDIRSNDEIEEIYQGIRSMQIKIIDYLKDMFALQRDKQKAENDLKDRDERIEELSIETYKDALTGVGNKAAYIKKTEELSSELKNEGIDCAIVMVDINDLKLVNDQYGHKSGDQYIKGCCQMICNAFKHSPVYRIGGDEFVVILLGQDYENRKEICEKLKKDYEKSYEQKGVSPWLRYSAAVGLAERAADDSTIELVFKRADKAMYQDKARFKERYGETVR